MRTSKKTTPVVRESDCTTSGYVIMQQQMLLTVISHDHFKSCCHKEVWDGIIYFTFIEDGPVYSMLMEIRKEAL